jgi:tape measure domain-containing protein
LIATYAGFQGAIQLIKGAVNATVTLQAAENRLNVHRETATSAMWQTSSISCGERRTVSESASGSWRVSIRSSLRRPSARTSKARRTQKIFIAVSEAARVLGLSVDDTEGVFKALGQIASKGTVQMEELRGQLGDRFPAALKLMADGLGVSIQQLQNMVKAGSVSSDALSGFADQINKRYGSSLQKALQTTQAEIGRFGNNFFQALAKIANGGLISAFDDLLKSPQYILHVG